MRLRCCVILCALCTTGLADSAQDYFWKAFKRAMPSPFVENSKRDGRMLLPLALSGVQTVPGILAQPRMVVAGPGECAIPLVQTPISKDRQYLIRKLPVEGASKADPMTAPKIPVCRE